DAVVVADDELDAEPEQVLVDVDLIPERRLDHEQPRLVEALDDFIGRERPVIGEQVLTEEDDSVPVVFSARTRRPARDGATVAELQPRQRACQPIILDTEKCDARCAVEQQVGANIAAETATDTRHEVGAELPSAM